MRFMATPTPVRRLVRNAILRGSVRSRRLRARVDSGKLATPAVYSSSQDGVIGHLAPGATDELRDVLAKGFAVLVVGGNDDDDTGADATLPTQLAPVRRVVAPASLAPAYGAHEQRLAFLIRPDGYAAARLAEPAGDGLERALGTLLAGLPDHRREQGV